MNSEFYCPHCYKQICSHELLYFKPSCGDKFPPPAASLLLKMKLAASPSSISCNKNSKSSCKTCNRQLSFRACPICKGTIPAGMAGSPIIIAVAGAEGSGKTSYIQAAIAQLRKLSEIFNWILTRCDTAGSKNAMFILRRGKSDKGKLLVLAEMPEEALTPIVRNALSGIIYLVDPLQVEAARDEIQAAGNTSLPTFAGTEPQRAIANLARGCETLPLAITLAKIDTLITTDSGYTSRWLLNADERLVCRDSNSRGKLNTDELDTIHCEMESWLTAAYPPLCSTLKNIQKCGIFGCSTMEPALRVEDPLLWILSCNKIMNI